MANPDIPAALTQLQTHLVAAGAALTDKLLDVDRGLPATRGRQLRYYWGGEVEPPRMDGPMVLNGEMVGQRFIIAALWPLSGLDEGLVTAIDTEMQVLAGEIRTRLNADNDLADHCDNTILHYAEPDIVTIANARHVVLLWDFDIAYIEYPLAK